MAESMRKHRSVSGGGWQPQVAGGGRVVLPRVGARLRRVRGRTDIRMVDDHTRLIARGSANGGHGNGRPTQGITLKGKPESG